MRSAFQLLPLAQPMEGAPGSGAHLKAAEGAPGSGAQFSILSTLQVAYSLHFASSLFSTLSEFSILYILQLFISLYKQYTCTTSPGAGGGGRGPHGGRLKAPARALVRIVHKNQPTAGPQPPKNYPLAGVQPHKKLTLASSQPHKKLTPTGV